MYMYIHVAAGGSSGVVGRMVSGVMGLLFRVGSLLYLAATAILCLDVIILHRYMYMYIHVHLYMYALHLLGVSLCE